ncbi:iron-containing redox enzyme family protein [Tumidithrix helvetica]|uniref:iron-containing redox enzyme family protein n=1 Tax=Tumidithrix helvetica TaxID=3457545 RepID=UPI003CC5D316
MMQMLIEKAIATPRTQQYPELAVEALFQLPSLQAAVWRVAEVYNFNSHPYMLWMEDPTTDRDAFRRSQLPFRFAVESFSQPLAAVLARTATLESRLPLLANITEEHGHGDRWRSHKYTFQQYLRALGATDGELESPCTIPVLAFNQSILTYCLMHSGESGAAMLGIIEHLYVGISAAIARTLDQRGWTAAGSQSHYAVHEKLDTEHARDLLLLAETGWMSPYARGQAIQGLILGAHYFWSLYHGL